MRVKEFLKRARLWDEQIKSLAAERDYYRQLADNLGGGNIEEHVSRSGKSEAPYAKFVERIADKDKAIDEALDRLLAAKMEISAFVDRIENPEWQCLLRHRYVLCKTWPDIAVDMDISLRTVHRLYKKILKNFGNDMV